MKISENHNTCIGKYGWNLTNEKESVKNVLKEGKYTANFHANNGTSYMHDIEGDSLSKLIKIIRDTAEGERFLNNACSWYVKIKNGRAVAAGGVHPWNRRYRVPKDKLYQYD